MITASTILSKKKFPTTTRVQKKMIDIELSVQYIIEYIWFVQLSNVITWKTEKRARGTVSKLARLKFAASN